MTEGKELMTFPLGMAASAYGFSHIEFIGWAGGISSKNALVSAGGSDFVLKRFRGDSTKVDRIERVTSLLLGKGLPVIEAMISRDGKRHFFFDGHFYALYRRAKGLILHRGGLGKKHLENAALLLSQIHGIKGNGGLNLESSHQRVPSLANAIKVLEAACDKVASGRTDISRLIRSLTDLKRSVLSQLEEEGVSPPKPCSLIHGDYHNENLLFRTDGKVDCVLDFEHVRNGAAFEDVVTFLNLACLGRNFDQESLESGREFVRAYRRLRELTTDDLVWGFRWHLRDVCSSAFLERAAARERENLGLIEMLERDIVRIDRLASSHVEIAEAIS